MTGREVECGTDRLRREAAAKGVTLLILGEGAEPEPAMLEAADIVAVQRGRTLVAARAATLAGALALSLTAGAA